MLEVRKCRCKIPTPGGYWRVEDGRSYASCVTCGKEYETTLMHESGEKIEPWENQFPLNTESETRRMVFVEFIKKLLVNEGERCLNLFELKMNENLDSEEYFGVYGRVNIKQLICDLREILTGL
jgi:hypothetical protein